jgi:hypothetical protein
MNKNLDIIAEELFGKIRTQFSKIQLGDAESKVTDEPNLARFFEFDFSKNGNALGTISVSLSEEDGLVVMYSNDIVENQTSGTKASWFNFLRELREFAKQNLLNFQTRDISKSNLDKRDYQFLAKRNGEPQMTESKLWGTSKTSYQDLGEAKLIVKHSQPVNYNLPAGRTQHIESIYIENSQGERFRYPYKHLNGARALARHVANGGNSYDAIGEHIIGLSEELSKLRMFKGYVERNNMVSETMGSIHTKVLERIDQVKKEIHGLQNQNYYQSFAESFENKESREIPEDVMNDWIDRLTIRTFNEELKNVFPYIYKLVDESELPVKELNPQDLLSTQSEDVQDTVAREISELQNYEYFLDQLVGESSGALFKGGDNSTAIEKLKEIMAEELPVGTDGTNAIESLSGLINDEELSDIFRELADVNPESDARNVIKDYIKIKDEERGTDIASELGFAEELPAEEPAAAEPAPAEQPVTASIEREGNAFAQAVQRAKAAGMKPGDKFKFGEKEITLQDAMTQAGLQIEDFFGQEEQPKDELSEFVSSMFDRETGNFPKGETGVLLAVEKKFGEDAVRHAHGIMQNLVSMTESYRIKKLAGLA